MTEIIGVRFKSVGKVYYFSPDGGTFSAGDKVIVETARGVECGEVALANKMIPDEEIVAPLKPVIRKATEEDFAQIEKNHQREQEAFGIFVKKAAQYPRRGGLTHAGIGAGHQQLHHLRRRV